MLVLSRHRDETIMIGDDIELTVVDIRGDKVRLGIKAPTEIAVHRKEVYESIKRENRTAAMFPSDELGRLRPNLNPASSGPRPDRAARLSQRPASGRGQAEHRESA